MNVLKEIYGTFDGKNMAVDDCNAVTVPENYASKSMLIQGTQLVYRITDEGAKFKQLSNPEYRVGIGYFNYESDEPMVLLDHDNMPYKMRILGAFVTFFRLQPGDQVVVRYPEKLKVLGDNWCVVENKI